MLEQLAIRLRQFGYFDQALEVLKQGMKIDPRDPEILRELGFVYRKKGPMHHLEAERYMIEALELNDADAELHGMLGGLLKRKDNYIQALVHYRRANELEPENLYPIVNLGGISAVLGDMDAAIRWYGLLRDQCNKLIVSHKADYWTYLCLGESSVVLGKEEEAVKAYLEASKMDPPSEDLRSAIEQLEFLLKNNVGAEIAGGVLTSLQENPDSR
jgi:tetratricopeptide (TPR) repeat protein